MRGRTLGVLLTLLLSVVPAYAQEQRGAIQGIVKDSTGAVLPGAIVEAKNVVLGSVTSTTSDGDGSYRFPALAPGRYTVTAALEGLTTAKVENIDVALGAIKTVDVALGAGGQSESIQVTAEAPLVDTKQSASFQNIRDELITKLPRGRDFTNLITIAPGTNNEMKLAGLSIDGSSGAENSFLVDGINTNNVRTGQSGKMLVSDFVEEVQVKSSGYAAEFGGSTGGVISAISRSGTNRFRGDADLYFRSNDLRGGVRPTLRLNPDNSNLAEYITYPDDTQTITEPGFTLGGPIARDRVWFFAGYIPNLERTERTAPFNVNRTSGTFTQERTRQNLSGNIQTQLTSKLRARFATNIADFTEHGRLPELAGTSDPTFPFATPTNKAPNRSYSGTVDYVATSKLYFGVRTGYFGYDNKDSGVPDSTRWVFSNANIGMAGVPAELQRQTAFNAPATNTASRYDQYSRASFDGSVTYFASLGGQHTFKAGMQYDRYHNNAFSGEQAPRVTLFWGDTYTANDGVTQDRGQFGYYAWRQFQTLGSVTSNNIGLYVQDSWTVSNRLTLNLGLRTENERVPSYDRSRGQDAAAVDFGFADKLAPRLGFAYDVKGDGRWKAFGSFSTFYDVTKLEMPRGSFGGDKWVDSYYTLDQADWTSIGVNNNFPGRFIEQIDRRFPSNVPGATTIDPDLKPVEQREITLGMEHELTSTISVGARYVRKRLMRTIEDVGLIVPGLGEKYYIANPGFGVAKSVLGPGFPDLPEAKREYDGLELRATKRFSNRWMLNTNYTWSRLHGNYSGLASSDENGRSAPNVNRFFDAVHNLYNQDGQAVYGRLATDRPHQFKVQGAYDLPWGTTAGANFNVFSGTPLSTEVNRQSIPFFPYGRGNLGRTPTLSATDIYLQHEIRLPSATKLQVEMNVFNLFDQDAGVTISTQPFRQNLNISDTAFFAGGFDALALGASQNLRADPRYQKYSDFQARREIRFSVRFLF